MKKIIGIIVLIALMGCSVPGRPGAHGSSVPSLAEFIQDSMSGTHVVCKQNGVITFEGISSGAVNAGAQHLIYRDQATGRLVFISTMAGQCQVTALSPSIPAPAPEQRRPSKSPG